MRRFGFALAFCLVQTVSALAQTVWTMPTEYPANTMPGEGVAAFAEAVKQRVSGLEVKPVFNGEGGLVSAALPEAVRSGRVQAADAFGGALGTASPVLALSSLPFLTGSADDARRLLDVARPLYDKTFSAMGLKLLYTTPWPPSGLWSKEALPDAAALDGLTVRSYDAVSGRVLDAAGAKASNLTFADVMPRLKDGSIRAVLSSGDGGAGRRLWEYLPHFTAINYAYPLSFAFVSRAAYDALTPDQRQAVDEAAAATEARQWAALQGRLTANLKRMAENGVILRDPAPADVLTRLKGAAAPVFDEWAISAGPEGAEVLRLYRAR